MNVDFVIYNKINIRNTSSGILYKTLSHINFLFGDSLLLYYVNYTYILLITNTLSFVAIIIYAIIYAMFCYCTLVFFYIELK